MEYPIDNSFQFNSGLIAFDFGDNLAFTAA
jgi:hypothetical protein